MNWTGGPLKPAFGLSGDPDVSSVTDMCRKLEHNLSMPWGLKRFQHTGQSHFVTFCCYHRHPSFTTAESRRVFGLALERVRRSFKLRVYGYVVMPDHVHLLLSEPECQTLAVALKSLKQGVSRRLLLKGGPLKPTVA